MVVRRVMRNPSTGQEKVYTLTQQIAAIEFPPAGYDMNVLKNEYNKELTARGVDAFVEACKEIRGTFQSNLVVDTWVAGESPIAPAIAALIILIIKVVAVVVGALVVLCAAASFVERIFPTPKFYTPDGKVFTSLTEYLTYMSNVYNPGQAKPYTCMYCGQGFATAEERDKHQANCPWKGGPPTAAPAWEKTLGLIVTLAGICFTIYLISKIFK